MDQQVASTTAEMVNLSVTASPSTLPTALATATYSTPGKFLQTRPTGNRATLLIATFINDSGTNATQISVSYDATTNNSVVEEIPGQRAYFSLTGATNSWSNIAEFSSAPNGRLASTMNVNWTNGGTLYLLWADDNGSGTPDTACQIGNFSLHIGAGLPLTLGVQLTHPAQDSTLLRGSLTASAIVLNGTGPFTVEYFTNSGVGNTVFASAGSSTSPFDLNLGSLEAGTYNIYAVVADPSGTPNSAQSGTNTFVVAEPIAISLIAPPNGASYEFGTNIAAVATVNGGTAPYAVQFFLDDVASGEPDTAAPFERDFGLLGVGSHTIRAVATDARGWASNSVTSAITISGAVAVTLFPTNGAEFNFGRSLVLTAALAGGIAPYSAAFYMNEQLVGTATTAPYIQPLGVLPVGSYTSYVHATDSSTPAEHSGSSTNVFTVLPNPLVATLTRPTNGRTATAGQPFALTATASVNVPLTVTNVQFFVNGNAAGTDTTAPFTGSIPSPIAGATTVHVIATDSLGRSSASQTNTVTFLADPLANDNFANRFSLNTPDRITAANAGATIEGTFQNGEPQFAQNPGGGFFVIGATLWWKWTAPFSGSVTIDTFGSDFDTFLGVYTGTAVNALTAVVQNNDAPGLANVSVATFNAISGTEYQVQVGGIRAGFNGPPATGTIKLNLAMPPFVAITNPIAGSSYLIGSSISVSATAGATAAAVTNVSLYRGSTLLGSADSAPYSFVISNAPSGTNALYAVATDAIGQVGTSSVVRILVANPGLTITHPVDDQIFQGTRPITIGAFAILPSGEFTNVSFFVDGQFIGQDATAPFTATWSNVVSGSHRLTATGLDASGTGYVAAPVNIGVGSTLIASNSIWKYLDNGSDQGTAWVGVDFDDSAWSSGPAPLGYADSNGRPPLTTNSFGADSTAKFPTTYYRQAFTVDNLASIASVRLNLQRDDGAILYLNGAEIGRYNMPAGTVTYTTFASANANDDGGATFSQNISPALLREGFNVLAAEIHQDAPNSSDIWFVMDLNAVPVVIHNLYPVVTINHPTNDQHFIAPSTITVEATASDSDGTVTNLEFFYGSVKIGETAKLPYSITWNKPLVGAHVIRVVATDNENGKGSAEVPIVVYDAASRPVTAIVSPIDGAVMEGPTNLLLAATAQAVTGITNVQFFANGELIGQDATSPYTVVWPSTFLSNGLSTVAFDATGASGTSPVVTVTITIPPTNTIAPTLVSKFPLPSAIVTNLTTIAVRFSELVLNVDAGDLLINGVPATGVTGSRSNYTFSFPQPPYGDVEVSFASDHNITDYGYPDNLPFDALTPDGSWRYTLIDRTIPTIAARSPATNAFVTNLTEITVIFSEVVNNVDASDLLVNGVPSYDFRGQGTTYTFSVIQPPSGTLNITWSTNHGIVDTASNAFNRVGAGSTWNFVLDSRTTLVASNSMWRFIKGFAEASDPTNAWRQIGFDDSSWSNAPAPFFYGDPYTNATITGTLLRDMRLGYSSIYLRKEFTIANRSAVTNLILRAQSDDGFIAWINGVQVLRYNAPNVGSGEASYLSVSSASAPEPSNTGAAYIQYNLTNALAHLVVGTNILSVHAFNDSRTNADDFGFNANLYTFLSDASISPPRVAFSDPVQGDVFFLTNITVTFSESVANVDVGDLLVNGVPATEMTSSTNTAYTFRFPQPAYGTVNITWASGHGIADFDTPAKAFDGNLASARLTYTLVNPSAPTIVSRTPVSSATVTGLTFITVTFSEPVTGVDASDLLVSGVAATALSSLSPVNYTFSFPQPAFGTITVRWATNHGIQDLEVPANDFAPARPGHTWSYNLINPAPAVTLTAPTNNAFMLDPANILVRATATDNDGTIALVEFYEGTSKIGEASAPPYSITWPNTPLGTYTFRAVATDNIGLMATSAPIVVNVVTSLPISLVRGPYLLGGSPTGGVVRWRTDQFSDGVVRYGTSPDELFGVATELARTNNHVVSIGGLEPDTKYFYSIGSGTQTIAGGTNVGGSNFWFRTSPVAGTPKSTRVWVLGDAGTATANQRAVRDSFYNYAASNNHPADLWLMLGDNAYNSGTDFEHQAAVFDMYPTTLRNLFLWPVLGNHESSQSYTAEHFPYLDIFTTPKNGEAGGVPSGNGKYYSFDYGNIHFIGLDSMTSTRSSNSAMANWLKSDLAASTQTWTVVYFHHPPYTKGSHNSDAESDLIQLRQEINPILESFGVDLVLSGHSHCYERSYLLDGHYGLSTTLNTNTMFINGGNGREDGDGPYRKSTANRGLVYTVAGSSGQATGGTLNHPAHFIGLNELGSVIIDVVSNRLDMKFLNSSGVERDHVTLMKREPILAPLSLVINGLGTVSGAAHGELLEIGRTHTLVATPGAGQIFAGWSGGITNANATLSFVMESNLVIVANFVPVGTPQFAPITISISGNGTVSGVTNSQLLEIGQTYTITAQPGADSVFMNWSGDATGSSSTLSFVMQSNLVIVANFVPHGGPGAHQLTLVINGDGSVAGAVNGQSLVIGQSYTLAATPASGWVFSNWSGGVSETAPTLNFVMQSNLVIVANFVESGGPGPFTPVAGEFNGLFAEEEFTNVKHAGFFNLRLTDGGRYRAIVHYGGNRYMAHGKFASDGKATNILSRAGSEIVQAVWEASLDDADLISGVISGDEWSAALMGHRSTFSRSNPAPQAGRYTFIIPGIITATNSPAGDGYGTIRVAPNGVARIKGRLADGAPYFQWVSVSKNGDVPFCDSLIGGRGVVLGWLRIGGDESSDVAGRLRWIKPESSHHRYPDGFAVNSDVLGSRYTRPVGEERILQMTEGVVSLTCGDLQDSSNPVTLGPRSKVVNNGPNALKLAFNLDTGVFHGSFREAGTTRTFPLRGVALQRQNIASGYALGGGKSGWIYFDSAQQ